MGRSIQTFVVGYLLFVVVVTLVTEVIAGLQGSSRVLGAFSSGAPVEVILTAVAHDWVIPVVTWPFHLLGFAFREMSARG